MLRVRWLLLGAALGFASTAALAFQETKGGSSGGLQAGGSSAVRPLDLKDTGTSVTLSPPAGLEVRIPGLGKLGVLPKFDFGLELLYGANDQKGPETDRSAGPKDAEDTQIRGSVRHRW